MVCSPGERTNNAASTRSDWRVYWVVVFIAYSFILYMCVRKLRVIWAGYGALEMMIASQAEALFGLYECI